jgi:hypothetical protein
MSLVNTYTYEEGSDGASIATGANGVIAEGGAVTYNAANAIHGSLAAMLAASASSLVYSLPASGDNSWSDSFYMKIGVSTGTNSQLVTIRNGGTQLAKLTANVGTGKFQISDNGSSVQATSTIPWPSAVIIRNDIQYSYDGANLTVSWKIFTDANSEGTTPDDTLTATFAASAVPTRFALGGITGGWTVYYDTYRQYSSSADSVGPYQPGSPPAVPLQIYDGSSLVTANAYVAVVGTGSLTSALNVDFEDGTTGNFSTVQGATVGPAYAYSGTKGCRMSPAAGTNYATLSYNNTPAGHTWARFTANFRIVTITAPTNTYTNVFEIGNRLTVSPKSQHTWYINGANLMMDFRTTTDATLVDDNVAVGVWHSVDVSVNFGVNPYLAHITYDGVQLPDLVSAAACTPSTVGDLWIGYPSTATDQTVDWDNIQLYVADSDPTLMGTTLLPATLSLQ